MSSSQDLDAPGQVSRLFEGHGFYICPEGAEASGDSDDALVETLELCGGRVFLTPTAAQVSLLIIARVGSGVSSTSSSGTLLLDEGDPWQETDEVQRWTVELLVRHFEEISKGGTSLFPMQKVVLAREWVEACLRAGKVLDGSSGWAGCRIRGSFAQQEPFSLPTRWDPARPSPSSDDRTAWPILSWADMSALATPSLPDASFGPSSTQSTSLTTVLETPRLASPPEHELRRTSTWTPLTSPVGSSTGSDFLGPSRFNGNRQSMFPNPIQLGSRSQQHTPSERAPDPLNPPLWTSTPVTATNDTWKRMDRLNAASGQSAGATFMPAPPKLSHPSTSRSAVPSPVALNTNGYQGNTQFAHSVPNPPVFLDRSGRRLSFGLAQPDNALLRQAILYGDGQIVPMWSAPIVVIPSAYMEPPTATWRAHSEAFFRCLGPRSRDTLVVSEEWVYQCMAKRELVNLHERQIPSTPSATPKPTSQASEAGGPTPSPPRLHPGDNVWTTPLTRASSSFSYAQDYPQKQRRSRKAQIRPSSLNGAQTVARSESTVSTAISTPGLPLLVPTGQTTAGSSTADSGLVTAIDSAMGSFYDQQKAVSAVPETQENGTSIRLVPDRHEGGESSLLGSSFLRHPSPVSSTTTLIPLTLAHPPFLHTSALPRGTHSAQSEPLPAPQLSGGTYPPAPVITPREQGGRRIKRRYSKRKKDLPAPRRIKLVLRPPVPEPTEEDYESEEGCGGPPPAADSVDVSASPSSSLGRVGAAEDYETEEEVPLFQLQQQRRYVNSE
ncbi:hypothetical protein IAU60_006761 [Kwoniella sp. DSM 27419]